MDAHNLPSDIRRMILNALLQTGGKLASHATVSREWQAVIEPHNFSHLKLTMPRVEELDAMTRRTEMHVQYIWLCLELQDYGCIQATSSQGMNNADGYAIGRALHGFLDAIYPWTPRPELVIDISIHSPSDSAYWFKSLTFEPDRPFGKYAAVSFAANKKQQHDGTGREIMLTSDSIRRIFSPILTKKPLDVGEEDYLWWRYWRQIPVVTAVLLRQQTRRRWSLNMMTQLLSRFPNLREIHYEPWRMWDDGGQEMVDVELASLIETIATSNLKKLSLFENFNQLLEQISASFITDASLFFRTRNCSPDWKWWSLTSLALTSQLLEPSTAPGKIVNLLDMAAEAAMKMPKLEVMELWNGRPGMAAIFRYQTPRYKEGREQKLQSAVMTWRGTWRFALGIAVVRAWERVTFNLHGNSLAIRREIVDSRWIASHADAIYHLKLAELVIRPVSLRQIRIGNIVGDDRVVIDPS
ncbi:hypothetical protein ACQKWADRAFT_327913 [Trichoderma austrokoningii]